MCSVVLYYSFHRFSNIESLKSWLSVAFARKKNISKVISVNSLSHSEPTLGALRLHGLSTKRAMAASVQKNPMCWKFLKKIHESSLNHSPSFTAVKMLRFCRNSLCVWWPHVLDVQQITRILWWFKFQSIVNTRTPNMQRQVKPPAHSKFNTHLKQQITQANTSPFTET